MSCAGSLKQAEQFALAALSHCLCRTLHECILPSLAAFDWSKKRDLPKPSWPKLSVGLPAIYGLHLYLQGAVRDLIAALPPALAALTTARLLKAAAKACYATFSQLKPSRFHTRVWTLNCALAIVVIN